MRNVSIITVGPNSGRRTFSSIRAASRALSGTGSDSLKSAISRTTRNGGGYIGNVYVARAKTSN